MSDETLRIFCEAIALMDTMALVAFESFSHHRDLTHITKLKAANPKLSLIYGVAEYARFHEQLVKLSADPIRIKEMASLVIQFSLCLHSFTLFDNQYHQHRTGNKGHRSSVQDIINR